MRLVGRYYPVIYTVVHCSWFSVRAHAQQGVLCLQLEELALYLAYLPTVPEFPGLSRKLTFCPAVPETIKIVPEIIHVPRRLLSTRTSKSV